MSNALLKLEGVGLTYPVFTVAAQSIRHVLLNAITGGTLLKDSSGVVHVQALQDISFTLFEGDRLGVVGHNGSGKTTLLKVIAGIYEPTKGKVLAAGSVSSMIDLGTGVDAEATGIENIQIMSRLRGFDKKTIAAKLKEIVDFADLGPFIDLPLRTYSAGMSMRLLFAISTAFNPEILVLDEWLGAGDAAFVRKAEARMEQFVSHSKLLVIASHNLDLIKRRCNKVLVLEAGRIKYFGSLADYYRPEIAGSFVSRA